MLGGYFDVEEHAAMKVNLLCRKYGMECKNPRIIIEPDEIQKVKNQSSSKHTGVSWQKHCKKWKANLMHRGKDYFGGYFDVEEHAAMQVNLLCDKYEIKRKNPMIIIKPDAMQKVPNKTSIYTDVTWQKNRNKWHAQLKDKGKIYYGGLFDKEEDAARKINLLCDKIKIKRKNPEINIDVIQKKTESEIYEYATGNIVNEQVKIEDEDILDKFKDKCENRFIQTNDDLAPAFQNSNVKTEMKNKI